MKRILLPTDFSDNARNAIYYGLQMFGDEPCKFTMINTFFIPYSNVDIPVPIDDITAKNAMASFEELLAQTEQDFPDNTFDIKTEFKVGDISGTVSGIVKRKSIDLVVMGTQGASDLADVLVGSQTSSVIRQVRCPVLAIPKNSRFKKPEKIVLAVEDEDDLTEPVLSPLLAIAKKFGSKLLLLHITRDEEDRSIHASKSELFKDLEHSYHTIYDKKVPHGIEEFVKDQKADMLAMTPHKLNLFERIFHRSISRKMSLHTEVPLLVMPIKK